MSTPQQHHASAAGVRASVLAGADVCAAAGFTLRPGGRTVMFDDEVWDFAVVEGISVQSGAPSITRLDFTAIADPRWRLAAKEYLFARVAPGHPEVAVLACAFRVPLTLNTCSKRLREVSRWLNWLTAAQVGSLGEVTQDHCDRYLAERRQRTDAAGAVIGTLAAAAGHLGAAVIIELAAYGELLSADRYRDGFTPWGGRSASRVAGLRPSAENKTPVVAPEILQPLLAAALYLSATIAPHLVTLLPQVRQRREETARLPEHHPDLSAVAAVLRRHVSDGEPLETVGKHDVGRRLRQGWAQDDPLLQVSFAALAREAGTRRPVQPAFTPLRPLIEQAAVAAGTAGPWGRHAADADRADGAGTTPWTLPITGNEVRDLAFLAHTACLLLVAALTGMRESELMELRAGCRSTSQHGDGLTRYRITSKLIKGQPLGGTTEQWVVIQAVDDAIGMAEQLAAAGGGASGDLLFGRFGFDSRYKAFWNWVNGPEGQRLGLAPIPAGNVTLRMLRRTLARELAYRPGGLLAAKYALKQVLIATTEGYAAQPGGAQGRLLAEIADGEADRNHQIVLEEYRNYEKGIMPAGPGARELTAFFASVDAGLGDAGTEAPKVVGSDQDLNNLLSKRAGVLHIAAANYCWFADPSRALCLKLAGTPGADKPLAGQCDSARCPQATHHACHRPAWADTVANTTAFIGQLGRTRTGERARLQQELDRAQRVLDEIDAAAGKAGAADADQS